MMRDPAPPDRELVERYLRSRSEASFLALYDRHATFLYRFAARLSGSRDFAADLTQEAWLRALAGLAGFRGDARLSTWLCAIVLNCWRERRRGEDPGRALAIVEEAGPATTKGPSVDGIALERALATLSPGCREVLLLYDVEGYSHEEIARHFGIAEGTSKSQLHHARRALRVALGARDEARA